MNLRSQTLVLGLALSALLSCKKSNNDDPAVKPPVIDTPKVVPGVDIYLVGSMRQPGNYNGVATYWKNGVTVKINDSLSGKFSYATDIAIAGKNVYLVGQSENDPGKITYWKNGAKAGSFAGDAYKITVSGNDVYVPGSITTNGIEVGKYWKNGVPVNLAGCKYTTQVVVSNGDVYVSGVYIDANGDRSAAYWRNGVITVLDRSSTANAIMVNGTDVYVAGSDSDYKPAYWENTVKTTLATPYSGSINAITIKGSDVYAVGQWAPYQNALTLICCWKNGVKADLITEDEARKSNGHIVYDLLVFGSDIYVSGEYNIYPTYWKNGSMTRYPSANGNNYWRVRTIQR